MSKSVQAMFSSISRTYDKGNDVLSFGVHRLWRKTALKKAGIHKKFQARALDICCGTGDFCSALQKFLHEESYIIGLDFVSSMLDIAKPKVSDRTMSNGMYPVVAQTELVLGDALSLPFPERVFDVCTIGFGIRNVDDPLRSLIEMRRVLLDGGKVIVLEFGKPESALIRPFFTLYSKYIMPKLGELISGNRSAYEYLPETSAKFPSGNDFCSLMTKAGFKNSRYKSLFGGIAYIYIGNR